MIYLGITEQTATWLLSQTSVLDAIVGILKNENTLRELQAGDLVQGPLRMSGSIDGRLCCLWNVDYLTGTGQEAWGFIRLSDPQGLLSEAQIVRKVFDTELQLISARLRGLRLDGSFIHRSYENGANTMRADRGELGRHQNLGYWESAVTAGTSSFPSIIVVGPAYDLTTLKIRAADEGGNVQTLADLANAMLTPMKRRPVLDTSISNQLKFMFGETEPVPTDNFAAATIATTRPVSGRDTYSRTDWTFAQWIAPSSPLSSEQRQVLKSDLRHPIRIVGPAGSGKSLVMQLLAVKLLNDKKANGESCKMLYLVHNAAMEQSVTDRFEVLGATDYIVGDVQSLDISTLSKYAQLQLGLDKETVIDVDAYETKRFQFEQVKSAMQAVMNSTNYQIFEPLVASKETNVFKELFSDPTVLPIFASLITAEFSTAIKGYGLVDDRQRYVLSERGLSRLHGIMGTRDRNFVYDIFERYNREVFVGLGVLDADDIALSLLGRLRTPIWQLKRKTEGYDFVFVDETQLFNENERKIIPLLTKGAGKLAPIALAMDEGQEFFGQTTAGFAALGIEGIEDERLPSNHRSTRAIVDLAFFVIEKSTDLFGPGFPRYSDTARTTLPDDDTKARPPRLEQRNAESPNLGRFVAKKVSEIRKVGLRRIAVICHAEQYWENLERELASRLREDKLPFRTLLQRGELLPGGGPLCVLTRPAYVGGQEFDGVIVVGLEQGLTPPRIADNPTLEAAVEQQALREMYLSFSRARLQLLIVIERGAVPTMYVREAVEQRLIVPG